jgi:hypothetical protein
VPYFWIATTMGGHKCGWNQFVYWPFDFWHFCLLPFCFYATSFSPSSCLICFSNCNVAIYFFGHPTRRFYFIFEIVVFCLALSLMSSTSFYKTSSFYTIVIVLNRLRSKFVTTFLYPFPPPCTKQNTILV